MSSLTKNKHSENGFTLIELLVVIATIGILASLMMPAVSSSRARAKKAGCTSNLKQIGAAWANYATDHDGLVISQFWIPSLSGGATFIYDPVADYNTSLFSMPTTDYLIPYLGANNKVMVCPGTTFSQGVETFCFGDGPRPPSGPNTYQGFTHWQNSVRRIYANHVGGPIHDERNGWDKRSPYPIFMDPIIRQLGWRVTPGGQLDQEEMIVHGNTGTLPVLMDDGHVIQFDRSGYPPIWGNYPWSENPLTGYKLQVDEMLGL